MNLVERWFRELTDKCIRRGSFNSVSDLIEKINLFIEHHNIKRKDYIWMTTGEDILIKVERARTAMARLQAQKQGTLF
jgi:hypothetical protein